MLKLYRNVLAAGVIALGLAACGDDVTVTPPPPPPTPPTPGVTSVTVSPATQTINIGQEVFYSAAVMADVGITNTTVGWTSRNPAIATVDTATGKVKGITPGTTTIVAFSNVDNSRIGIGTVTVVALPPGVVSFNANPAGLSLFVGGTATGGVNAVYASGVTAPTISWSSLNTTVASVNSTTGLITANAPGVAIIRATATLPADPTRGTTTATILTADITVTVGALPSISINSVTQGATTVPVNISNVLGQIEVNLNFNPRELPMDSVVVYLDQPGFPNGKTASKQAFNGAVPAAGNITLSINTASFDKIFATGLAPVKFLNGATTVRAVAFRTGSAVGGPVDVNCSVAPGTAICASPVALNLNNADGWAADYGTAVVPATGLATQAKPARSAQSPAGLTYWGGPGATGTFGVTLYSVIYTPGRDISVVNWTVGTASTFNTCATSTEVLPGTPAVSSTRPWRRVFGYTAGGATVNCAGHEWTGAGLGDRDNVIVFNAIDTGSNPYIGTLIPNTVVATSTPDSLRLDYVGPQSLPNVALTRTAPAVTGWVNGTWDLTPAGGSTDFGVGVLAGTRSFFYNAPNCGGATAVAFTTTVAGNNIPECSTNFIGGSATFLPLPTGTAPYTAFYSEQDRLTNSSNSATSNTFGVDRTAPLLRAGLAQTAAGPFVALVATTPDLGVFGAAKPVAGTNVWRYEYFDERSGFFNFGQPSGGVAAQRQAISMAGHFNNAGLCVAPATGPIGAAFVTAPACNMAPITVGGPVRADGWQTGQQVDVPVNESYYGYSTIVTDAAGNNSATLQNRLLVNNRSPFSTGLGIPATITAAAFTINATYADSAEVLAQSFQTEYPNFPGGVDSVRYTRGTIGTAFDNVITSPFSGPISPSTPAPFARRVETVTGTVWDGFSLPVPSNVQAIGAPTNVKPTSAAAWAWNDGSIVSTVAPARSLVIAIPALNVQDGIDIGSFNAANPTIAVNYWRVIPTLATTDNFGSSVPLRAQAVSPTNAPNPPFVRVDFYRLINNAGSPVGGTVQYWTYLGSNSTAISRDNGSFRSWVWDLATANFVARWDGTAQSTVAPTSGHRFVAVGITAAGDAIVTAMFTAP